MESDEKLFAIMFVGIVSAGASIAVGIWATAIGMAAIVAIAYAPKR